MKRRKAKGAFGFSPLKFNLGSYVSANPPTVGGSYGGVLSGVQPKNISGVVPIIGGYALNAIVSNYTAGKIPMTKTGIGNYALSLVNAGLLGALAGMVFGKNVGSSVLTGAIVEPVVRAVRDVSNSGFSALSLKAYDNEDIFQDRPGALTDNIIGQQTALGDFTTPGQITGASPTESSMSQYSLPQATAQVAPQQTMQAYEDAVVAEAMQSAGGM